VVGDSFLVAVSIVSDIFSISFARDNFLDALFEIKV
jgi:hypothetical protein